MGSKADAADDLRYPPWSGVGEPGPHSLRLSQLTTVLKEKNPEVWGFYREAVKTLDQERQSLQSQLESPDITYNQKRTIDQRILTIDSMVPAEISDDDITTTILTHPTPQYNLTHLSNKLIETVPAEDPEHPILRSFGESFDRLVEDLPDFLVGAAHTFYMSPKDRPGQRRKYDLILRANVGRAEKLRSLLETKPESILAGRWEKELGRVNEFIDTHPEWKDKEPYPEEALTPQQLHWKEASDKIIDEARDDLENVHLVSADKLAYYKWQKEGQLIDWTDPKKWTATAFQHAIGSGLASFVPAAAIGLSTGFLTKNPTAGLAVGRIAMGIMEGSDEYRQALDYALENGLDMEEARHLATYTGTAYGIGSAWMEGWVPGMWMRRLGLLTGKGYSTMFGKALFGNMSRKSVGKYAGAKRMFGKAVDKIPYFVQSGATEGFQELSQYLYQVSIQAGYKDVGETYVDRYMNVYDVGEAATSAYAGTVFGGTLGIPVGIAARLTKKEKEAVEAAERVEEEVTRVVPLEEVTPEKVAKVVPLEEVVPEEVVADPLLDYVNRLSDIDRVQLSPEEEPVEGSSKLDISVYKHQYDKSSSDKLLGLIEDVGKDVISAVESLSPENKTDLLDRLMVQVNRENPGVDIKTEEEAMNFLNAFSESGAIVSVKEKVPLGEKAKVITKTKFDPAKMSERAQQNIIKMGFDPKKSFITPPKIKPEAPPPKVPPVPKLTREGKAQMGKLGYTPIDVTKMTSERIGQILEKQIAKPPVPKIVPPTEPPIKPPVPKPRPPEPRPPTPAPPPSPKKPSVKNQEIIDEIARLNAETSELDIGYDDIRQINWNSLTPNVQNNPKAQKLAQEFSDLSQKIRNMSPAEVAELPESIRNEFVDYPATWGYSRAQKGVSVHNVKNMLEMYEYTLRTKGKERAEEYFNSREINEKTPKEVVAKWSKGVEEINRVVEKEEAAAAIAKEAPLAPPVEAPGEVKEEAPVEDDEMITLYRAVPADKDNIVVDGNIVSPDDNNDARAIMEKFGQRGVWASRNREDAKGQGGKQDKILKFKVPKKWFEEKAKELGLEGDEQIQMFLGGIPEKYLVEDETTDEAPVEKPSLAFQDVIVSKKQDRIVGAQTDLKNNRIIVSKKVLQKKYKEKAWTKPKVKGVDPLPKDTFKTYEEWENFVIAHERAHFTKENRAIKNLAERENDANRIALEKIKPTIAPPVAGKRITSVMKEFFKSPEDIQRSRIANVSDDVVVGYISSAPDKVVEDILKLMPADRANRLMDTIVQYKNIIEKDFASKSDREKAFAEENMIYMPSVDARIQFFKELNKPIKAPSEVAGKAAPAVAPKKPRLHVIGKDYVDKTPIADKETIQKSLIDIMGKHAPDVQDTFVKEIEESPEAVGRYIDGMVQFILGKATETTAVHEPIHWFVERVLSQKDYDFLHDKFLTNEAMVEAATDSYMKKKTFRGKVKSLFRKMWNAIKKFLGIKLTSDETVTEMFDRIGVEFDIRRPAVGKPRLYKPKKEPTSEPIEGDESEGKREDGVDFSREVKPEEVSETDEGYVEAPDEQDEIIGSLYTNDYRSASLANYQSYFQDVFNRHISKASHAKMVEIAKRNKEVGFTQFFAEVREWAVNLLDENGVGVDINKTYSREQRAYMKQFFNKSNSRIALFDSSTEESIKRTAGGRIYMDLFITRGERGDIESFLFNYSLTEQLSTNPDGNKKRPSYYISNFTEDRNGPLTIHIRMDHIQEVMYNEKYDEERARVAREKGVVYNVPREFLFPANIRITGDIIRQWDTIFADDFTNKGDPNLMFVAGSKGGNDSVIFLGIVSKEHRNMNAAGFSAYLQSEVDRGLVTPDQRLEAISVADDHFGTNNQIYGQIAGKHEWWKGVTGSNYLLRLRKGKPVNIREHFNRLRGPFSEGTNPLGIKDSRMMLIDSKEVKMKVNGKNVDLFPHAGVYAFDGHFMSSGEWFRDLENNIGYLGDLYEAKTYINDLSENLVDYLSLKMMQMPPIAPGVQFIKDGKVIAEVKLDSRTGRTYFVTPEGERFEHIGSDEEAKMIAGKYDRDVENGGLTEEDGFYKLHTLTSKNFKVLFVAPEQSKTDVAYPVAEAELALDKNFIGSEKFDMFISSVKTYYETVGNSWLDDLYDFHVDAEKLRDELYRDLNTGQLPTDLQRWISMIGENGEGIHIPHITKLISSYLNNKMINNGMYKVREKGMGTSLFVKPKAHLNIEQGEVSVSARNTTYYDIVKDKYESEGMAFISMMATLDREGAVQAMMEFDAKPLEDRIDELNRWLEANKDRNPLWVKIHRQPVTGPSVVLMRKMSQLVLGEHGEAIFMTDQDLATLQSDSDGDMAGVTHFKDKDLTNVLVAWHESVELQSRKKIVYTQAFLTDKKQTSMINYKHFIEAATETTVASGSQGIVTNSKTIGNLLAFKELKVKIRNPNRNKKGWNIEARQPSEEVIMSYARLDKEALMENDGELYNLLIKQGDKIVSATGKELALDELDVQKSLYLKTTHEHQMSTLLQFAVDDTSLGLLAKIGYDFKFITDRMWRNTDGSRVKNITGVRHVLSELRRIFNYSPMRKGIGSEGRLTMAENIIDSKALDNFLNMSKSKQSADLVYRINNAKNLANKWYYKGFHVESVSIETGRETPVESLLRLLAKKNHDMVNRPTPSDDNMLYTRDWSGTIGVFTEGSMATAHVMAMKELEQNWDNTVVEKGVTKNDMAKGVKFIKKVDPEFRDIFKDMKSTRAGKFIQPKPEHNDMLHDLVDKHIEEFNSLSENAQIYATLYFLSGTATRTADGKPALRVNILRLLPLDLMHEGIALKYAQTWWKMMNKPSHSVYKEGKDFRNETYKGFKFGAALELARKKNEESCG